MPELLLTAGAQMSDLFAASLALLVVPEPAEQAGLDVLDHGLVHTRHCFHVFGGFEIAVDDASHHSRRIAATQHGRSTVSDGIRPSMMF
jgi:hypothetical protein